MELCQQQNFTSYVAPAYPAWPMLDGGRYSDRKSPKRREQRVSGFDSRLEHPYSVHQSRTNDLLRCGGAEVGAVELLQPLLN